jgi:hypothetical protein
MSHTGTVHWQYAWERRSKIRHERRRNSEIFLGSAEVIGRENSVSHIISPFSYPHCLLYIPNVIYTITTEISVKVLRTKYQISECQSQIRCLVSLRTFQPHNLVKDGCVTVKRVRAIWCWNQRCGLIYAVNNNNFLAYLKVSTSSTQFYNSVYLVRCVLILYESNLNLKSNNKMYFSLRVTLLYFLSYTMVEFILYGAFNTRNYNRMKL